jgi:hypothetical protein
MAVLGLIQLAFSLLGLVAVVVLLVWSLFEPGEPDDEVPGYGVLIAFLVTVGCVGWNWLIVLGALRFRKFRSYGLVLTASILFLFSIPFYYCALVTLPVAVWALIALFQRTVRARFAAVAKGETTPTRPESLSTGGPNPEGAE